MLARKTSLAIGALCMAWLLQGCSGSDAHTLEHLSPVYKVDREYRSMKGPASTQTIGFPHADAAELVWITGYRATMVGADGETPASQEYMCHSNLDFDPLRHAEMLGVPLYHTNRLFTLSQGQFDITFPKGFGLPYYTDETFQLTTQVLNLNPDDQSREVRHKVTIDYVKDSELEQPMKPLFMTSGWGLVLIDGEEGYFGVADPTEEEHGPGCLPGEAAGVNKYEDEFDRDFAGHWVVKPGREVNRTLVTNIMKIPYDTTLHYIAVHLHPFAESLELLDLTASESVFKSDVTGATGKIGIDRVEYFSSEEGIPIYKDHDYELVSTYNNTTSEDQDSMAVMLLYLKDQKFKKRDRSSVARVKVAHVDEPKPADDYIMFETSVGRFAIELYPDAAPRHVERLVQLTRLGVYDGTMFNRVEPDFLVQSGFPRVRTGPPLTEEQKAAIRPLKAEFNDLHHRRGVVSMVRNNEADPHSAEASFFIILEDSLFLDHRYTVVGRVIGKGMKVVDNMTAVPREGITPLEPIVIESAKVVNRATVVAQR